MFFGPQTVENRAALRTALAALASVLISFKFHLETPFWSGMSAVIVSNLYTGHIVGKAILRIIGTVVGAFLGFYIAGLVVNSLLLYFLSCFLIVSICAYYNSFSTSGYAYLLGGLCAFIIISQIAMMPQNAFFVAIWRPVEIGIGVLVASISAYFIFPNHLKDNIGEEIDTIFNDFSIELTQLLNILFSSKPDFDSLAQSHLKIKKKIRKAEELIAAMNFELGVSQIKIDEVRALFEIFYNLSRQVHYLILILPQYQKLTIIQSLSIKSISNAVQNDLQLLQRAFDGKLKVSLKLKLGAAITELEEQLKQKQQSGEIITSFLAEVTDKSTEGEESFIQSNFIHALIHFLEQVNQSFSLIESLVTRIPIKKTLNFEILDIKELEGIDVDAIKRSIRAGFSVLLSLSFWLLGQWPGGLNGIISSLIISIKKNLFEMKNISIHLLLGCMLGGSVALFSLFIFEMRLYNFIIIFFFSIWGFSYLMFQFPKYAYIGLQANIALIISLAQEGGPPVSLGPPLQRLGGVVIGITTSFIVANLLWRSDVWTMLNRCLNKLYEFITKNLNEALLGLENPKKIFDVSNLFWVSREMLEALANESLNPKKEAMLTELTKRFESLVMIQVTISHILLSIDRKKINKIAYLLECDLSSYEKEVYLAFKEHDVVSGLRINHKLGNFLKAMEDKKTFKQVRAEDLRGFLAYLNALNQLVLRIY